MRVANRSVIAGLLLLLSASVFSVGAAAATISISVDGVESIDGRDAAGNTVVTIDLGAMLGTTGAVVVSGIGWDVGIDTVGASWLSEATIGFEDSSGGGLIDLRPGIDDTFAGASTYNSGGIMNLDALAFTLSDGILLLNFHETFDDVAGVADAFWSGTLSLQAAPVPAPAAVWLLLSALGILGARAGGTKTRT